MAPPALNSINQALKIRVLSAAVLLPIVTAFVYVGGEAFSFFLAVVAVLMAGEWDRLTGSPGFGWQRVTLVFSLLLALALGSFLGLEWALLALFPIGVFLALIGRYFGRGMAWPVLGLIWLGLPCLALMWLRMSEHGMLIVSWLFLSVWTCDTAAFFIGRGVGGPKLVPGISPKKTWAGLLGGILTTAGLSGLFPVFTEFGSIVSFTILGAALALISQCGDLAESCVKRRFEVKDSGALIPGHGGILDRVDGLLFAAPALVIFLLIYEIGNLPW